MGRLASAILAVIATPPLPTMASAIARLHAYSAGVRRDASRALPQRRQTCQHAAAFLQDLQHLAWKQQRSNAQRMIKLPSKRLTTTLLATRATSVESRL